MVNYLKYYGISEILFFIFNDRWECEDFDSIIFLTENNENQFWDNRVYNTFCHLLNFTQLFQTYGKFISSG